MGLFILNLSSEAFLVEAMRTLGLSLSTGVLLILILAHASECKYTLQLSSTDSNSVVITAAAIDSVYSLQPIQAVIFVCMVQVATKFVCMQVVNVRCTTWTSLSTT